MGSANPTVFAPPQLTFVVNRWGMRMGFGMPSGHTCSLGKPFSLAQSSMAAPIPSIGMSKVGGEPAVRKKAQTQS